MIEVMIATPSRSIEHHTMGMDLSRPHWVKIEDNTKYGEGVMNFVTFVEGPCFSYMMRYTR